jgi:hypothetical protein
MKLKNLKYWNFRTAVVLFLLVSFNLVLLGRDLHNCICNPVKAEVKKSCCKKEQTATQKNETKSCCSKDKNKKHNCDKCSSCKFDSREAKNEKIIYDDKITNEITKTEKTDYTIHNIKPYSHTNFTQERLNVNSSKLFLSISNLRI